MSTKRTVTTLAAAGLTVVGATLGLTTMVESQSAASTTATSSTSTISAGTTDQSRAVSVVAGASAPAAATSGS